MTRAGDGVITIPVSFGVDPLAIHQLDPRRYPFLLQSTADGTAQGRYDILFGEPGTRLTLAADGQLAGDAGTRRFLQALDNAWAPGSDPIAGPAPFRGGWFLLLGYELAAEVEPSLQLRSPDPYPIATAIRVPIALVRDRQARTAWVVAEAGHELEANELARLVQGQPGWRQTAGPVLAGTVSEARVQDFLDAVEAAKEHIRAGDIFQANLSREWTARTPSQVNPGDIYARLRDTNPGPFAGLAVFDDFAVISSSPERLLSCRDRQLETRPIAGTRPRLVGQAEDVPARAELIGHPKERAEHVMLIDLERNDLGRVCDAGTVEVDEFMTLESYAHVHHIVSNVRGRARKDVTPAQLIRAVFPGGTITGCPKVRCMEIIAELEDRPRGFYTGAMGYLGHDGNLDLNILIRTMVTAGNELSLAAGGGIVADSVPERELEETRAKAKGMLLALE